MSKHLIGLGQCSSFFLFILGNGILKCLRDCLFNFTAFNPKTEIGLFGFKPILSDHSIITNIYMYLSYIILGLIFFYITNTIIMQKSNRIKRKVSSTKLIHTKKNKITYKRIFQIISVSLIFVLHSDLIKMIYLFGVDGFDIWTSDILFMLIFMKIYFQISIFKHQKYSLLFIIITCTILLIISTLFPYSDKEDSYNSYKTVENLTHSYFFCIPIFLIFMLISFVTSFGRVLSKMLMDIKFISPYIIIITTGIIGFFLNIIILMFSTNYNCIVTENAKNYTDCFCLVHYDNHIYYDNITYDENISYYDNFKIYITNLQDRYHNVNVSNANQPENDYFLPKTQFFIEILAMTPIYFVVAFLEFTCEIFIIYYLNPNYILIRDNLYYGTSRVIKILYTEKYYEHISLLQFCILELAEIFAIFGYLIYLEIIELRFCDLDKNLKRHIIERGENEMRFSLSPLVDSDSDSDDDENNEEKDQNNEKNI